MGSEQTKPKRRAWTATERMTSGKLIGSPSNIEVLLHCYRSAQIHPRAEADAVIEAIEGFLACGAIEPAEDEGGYRTTALGRAWVEALCRVPMPRCVYVDKEGSFLGACVIEQENSDRPHSIASWLAP